MELNEIKKQFYEVFGEGGDLRVFTSPGRVNLIGEHIDYCGGHVLPAALKMATTLVVRKRDDDILRLKATDLDIVVETKISEMESLKGKLKWGDYPIGVAIELQKKGYDIVGCDLLFDDAVPHGGGLSSSAAEEVSSALCFATLSNEKNGIKDSVNMIEMALVSQAAEHNFIGVNCGIMDQFASAMGKENHAIDLNCATLDYEHIPLKMDGCKLVITNTNVKHSLGSSAYNQRRQECEEGLSSLQKAMPDKKQLADISVDEFEKNKDLIESDIVRNRIKHVVYECDRVSQSAVALKKGDMELFGKLMNDSHRSLQFDYEVTCPELDFLANNAQKMDGVLGSRMTGAGFGGCTVSIIKDECVDKYIKEIGEAYLKEFGHEATFFVTEIGDGGREI